MGVTRRASATPSPAASNGAAASRAGDTVAAGPPPYMGDDAGDAWAGDDAATARRSRGAGSGGGAYDAGITPAAVTVAEWPGKGACKRRGSTSSSLAMRSKN
jgi:hypothetical protein